MKASTYKPGDKVTTIHGEKLTVLDVKEETPKRTVFEKSREEVKNEVIEKLGINPDELDTHESEEDAKLHEEFVAEYNEQLKAVKWSKQPVLDENGEPVTLTYILAESGGHKCWFPETKLKGGSN